MAVRCAASFAMLILSTILLAAPSAARPVVTTDQCLGKGLCAYVDTKGHVTCGKCPGQITRAINVPAGTTAICNNNSFTREAAPARMCRAAGGIAMRVTP